MLQIFMLIVNFIDLYSCCAQQAWIFKARHMHACAVSRVQAMQS